jgi:hypothetical protein
LTPNVRNEAKDDEEGKGETGPNGEVGLALAPGEGVEASR